MIRFTHPQYLLLLPIFFVLAWLIARSSLTYQPTPIKRLSLLLRTILLCLIVFAIAGIQYIKPSEQVAVVFLVDASDSIPEQKRQEVLEYIRQAAKNKKGEQYIGLVVFGTEAKIQLAPTTTAKIDRIDTVASPIDTNIEQGLSLAIASFPNNVKKRIVLFSDGSENTGKAMDQAASARSQGIQVDVVAIANEIASESLLERLVLPDKVKKGEPFNLKVIAESKTEATAEIRLLRDGRQIAAKGVDLAAGKNSFTFSQTIEQHGSCTYEAVMTSTGDTIKENNRAEGRITVSGRPRILLVEGALGHASPLVNALQAGDFDVEDKGVNGLPKSIEALKKYDSIILSDVPASALTKKQMNMLERGVREFGIGLGMIGGDRSFTPGGYMDTPVEKALPVEMSVTKRKVYPSLTVVFVLDSSGSMNKSVGGQPPKVVQMVDSAVNTINLMQPTDKIAVVFCDTFAYIDVDLTPASQKESVIKKLTTDSIDKIHYLAATSHSKRGGGIFVTESLEMAYGVISKSNTRRKQIIMIADGEDCDLPQQAPGLAARMKSENITTTTIAITSGKDVHWLKKIAESGGGNFYLATTPQELPYIVTGDLMVKPKPPIVEETVSPCVEKSAEVLAGIDTKTMPALLGYDASTPKAAASVPIYTEDGDPIYAQWQYGLGRSFAYTSDAKPRWAVHWLDWPEFPRFWAQVARWSIRKDDDTDLQTTVRIEDAVGKVAIDAIDPSGNPVNFLDISAQLELPNGKQSPLKLEQTGPGRYRGEFPARATGSYTVNVFGKSDGESSIKQTKTATVSYPLEYKILEPNHQLLEKIAETTGGKVSPKPEEVFRILDTTVRAPHDLWWTFALLGILLFPADIAMRRLMIGVSSIGRSFSRCGLKNDQRGPQ